MGFWGFGAIVGQVLTFDASTLTIHLYTEDIELAPSSPHEVVVEVTLMEYPEYDSDVKVTVSFTVWITDVCMSTVFEDDPEFP